MSAEFLAQLNQRKLVQWALAYVAAAFALLQGIDIVAQRFGWPETLERILIIALCVGFFVTLLLAWYHGERGAQKVSGTELLLLALLLAIGGGLAWKLAPGSGAIAAKPADATVSAAPAADVSAKSVAVLPFTDLSASHDQEYFSDGMAEEILNALAQVKDLKVAGRTSSFFFKGKNEDLRTIGKTLSVANVLEGSVRKQGDKVRITAQLIQVSDGFHLWSKTYDGDLKDVFDLQERIARAITDQLQVVIAGEQKSRLVPVATTSPEAYELYLQATAVFNHRDGPRMGEAIAKLAQATRLDPTFARAHARSASLSAIAGIYTGVDQEQTLAAAEREGNIAIELDPTLAEPHAAFGTIQEYRRNWIAAQVESERATILDPNDPNAMFWRGLALADAGYLADGTAAIERAFCDFNAGDLENARRRSQLAIDQGLLNAERNLALISHLEGRDADAIAQFARGAQGSLAAFPENAGLILAEGIYGSAKQRGDAIAMIDAYLAGHTKKVSHAAPWMLLLLGEPARALAVAQDPKTDNDTLFMFWLWAPQGAVARKLTQFPEFVRKMGLSELWDQRGPPPGCRHEANGAYVCDY
jgi:TolB-like protein